MKLKDKKYLSKRQINFNFFDNGKYSNSFFNDVYGCSVESANKFILNNCFDDINIKKCFDLNKEYKLFVFSKICEKYGIYEFRRKDLYKKVKSNKLNKVDYLCYGNKCLDELKNFNSECEKRRDFLKFCQKFVDENKQMFIGFRNRQKMASYFGYGATCLSVIAILVWRAVEYNSNYKEIYNSIFESESLNLKNEYAKSLNYNSSEDFENYLLSFIYELSKDEALENLSNQYNAERENIAQYFGISSYDELMELINSNNVKMSRSDYLNLVEDKYNLNLSNLASDNNFISVEEMNVFLKQNVIYHPARRVYVGGYVWKNIPEYYEYKSKFAEEVYLTKEEIKQQYLKEKNARPNSNKEYETVGNPTLSVANDKLIDLKEKYDLSYDEILNDTDYPKDVYTDEVVESLANSYDIFCSTIPQKVSSKAFNETDFNFTLSDVVVPAGAFTCTLFCVRLLKIYAKANKKKTIENNIELMKKLKEFEK
ncbi:MAG: hypothetical protein ACI4TX_01005 [Christensenellales bacterium]